MTSDLKPYLVGPAEIELGCPNLAPTLNFFVDQLGFRVETIFPAEEPQVASLSGHGLRVRLAPTGGDPGVVRLVCRDLPESAPRTLTAPNGTRIALVDEAPPLDVPPLRSEFLVTRRGDGPGEGVGRAGMIYRDLIPGRLGGRFIASHILLPQGGPVADWVHYHKIRFQMIFCRKGWARLVYEDQGPPFIMAAGDCVLQPPQIRHRVLESSAGFEVVEIGCPALHETLADHEMELPNRCLAPERDFAGQRFLHHIAAETPWGPHGDSGFLRRDTGMAAASGGLADAYVLRPAEARRFAWPAHGGELLFGFVLEGQGVLDHDGDHTLGPTDAFVIPPDGAWAFTATRDDLHLLIATLPGVTPPA
jgi:quercetin dioxygenase-like cupin family protein